MKLIDSSNLYLKTIPWDQLEADMDPLDHGAEINLYSDTSGLKKAEIWIGLSRGPNIITVYFRDSIPFFISDIRMQYYFDPNKGEIDYSKPMQIREKKELYIYDWKNNYCFNLLNGEESETGPVQHPFSPHDYTSSTELALKYYKPM